MLYTACGTQPSVTSLDQIKACKSSSQPPSSSLSLASGELPPFPSGSQQGVTEECLENKITCADGFVYSNGVCLALAAEEEKKSMDNSHSSCEGIYIEKELGCALDPNFLETPSPENYRTWCESEGNLWDEEEKLCFSSYHKISSKKVCEMSGGKWKRDKCLESYNNISSEDQCDIRNGTWDSENNKCLEELNVLNSRKRCEQKGENWTYSVADNTCTENTDFVDSEALCNLKGAGWTYANGVCKTEAVLSTEALVFHLDANYANSGNSQSYSDGCAGSDLIWHDKSGLGGTATLTGFSACNSTSGWNSSVVGTESTKYLSFDGSDDVLSLSDITADFSSGLSVELWMKFHPSVYGWDGWFTLAISGSHNFELGDRYGWGRMNYFHQDSPGHFISNLGGHIPGPGQKDIWYHIVMTQDSSGIAKFFINGKLINAGIVNLPPSGLVWTDSTIGRSLNGDIGIFRLYSKSISETQVKIHCELEKSRFLTGAALTQACN